jgi:hypothetical protein
MSKAVIVGVKKDRKDRQDRQEREAREARKGGTSKVVVEMSSDSDSGDHQDRKGHKNRDADKGHKNRDADKGHKNRDADKGHRGHRDRDDDEPKKHKDRQDRQEREAREAREAREDHKHRNHQEEPDRRNREVHKAHNGRDRNKEDPVTVEKPKKRGLNGTAHKIGIETQDIEILSAHVELTQNFENKDAKLQPLARTIELHKSLASSAGLAPGSMIKVNVDYQLVGYADPSVTHIHFIITVNDKEDQGVLIPCSGGRFSLHYSPVVRVPCDTSSKINLMWMPRGSEGAIGILAASSRMTDTASMWYVIKGTTLKQKQSNVDAQ